jgi:hypothetical protein
LAVSDDRDLERLKRELDVVLTENQAFEPRWGSR